MSHSSRSEGLVSGGVSPAARRCAVAAVLCAALAGWLGCGPGGAATPPLEPPVLAGPAAAELQVTVRADQRLGPLPRIFRPSVMLSWADGEALARYGELGGPPGTVRVSLEWPLSQSVDLEDYLVRLRAEFLPLVRSLDQRGAQIVVLFARMPRWLASSADESKRSGSGFTGGEASPPRDYAQFGALAYETVRAIRAEVSVSPYYEFWNEPESRAFWAGTQDELFLAYEAFARAARRADPVARVGGLGGNWASAQEGSGEKHPLLQAFLQYVGERSSGENALPLDFVSWHAYASQPGEGVEGAARVREWLRAAGLPADLPQFLTEWNLWSTFPAWLDPSRDTEFGAAFLAAHLHAIDRAGLAGHTQASLQDFHPASPGNLFAGDFGLLTRSPALGKASFQVMRMLALLAEERVAVELDPGAERAGVGAVAAVSSGRCTLLLHRAQGDLIPVFVDAMRREGYSRPEQLALSPAQIEAFVRGRAALPGHVLPGARAALERAQATLIRAQQQVPERQPLRLRFRGCPTAAHELYRIGRTEGNPATAYASVRGWGGSHDQALIAARAHDELVAQQQGPGAPSEILELGPKEIVLIVLRDA